ncbi:MAG: Bcr/CflA family multidrug efflux MFS transporter [Plesiomonas sp.]
MTTQSHTHQRQPLLIFILGMLAMLTPLAIDMYLPSLPTIASQLNATAGSVQLTLTAYTLGFAVGQLFHGPAADSFGRKPIIIIGTLLCALASLACTQLSNIDGFIAARLIQGFAGAASGVVINALLRDLFHKDDFSRMMSMVVLIMTVAPLVAPLLGGYLLGWFDWHAIFWVLTIAAVICSLMVACFIPETLAPEKRQPFNVRSTLGNFSVLLRQRQVLGYMLSGAFSFAGMFTFLTAGSFVYIDLNGVDPQHFGYYFGLNILCLIIITSLNGRFVKRKGSNFMMKTGLWIQFSMGVWLVLGGLLGLGFWALVSGVALFVGAISIVGSNAMAAILEEFPHIAGTASSMAGTLRFGTGAVVGSLVAFMPSGTIWPMVGTMAACAVISIGCYYGMAVRGAAPEKVSSSQV